MGIQVGERNHGVSVKGVDAKCARGHKGCRVNKVLKGEEAGVQAAAMGTHKRLDNRGEIFRNGFLKTMSSRG